MFLRNVALNISHTGLMNKTLIYLFLPGLPGLPDLNLLHT